MWKYHYFLTVFVGRVCGTLEKAKTDFKMSALADDTDVKFKKIEAV